jgi:tetratricopeptide (TPR) repeat protein
MLPLKQLALASGLVVFFIATAQGNEPKTAREYYERGLIHEQSRQYEEAVADYSQAIELDPQFVEAYFSRSSLYGGHPTIEQRNYGKAVADLSKVLELNPRDCSARFNRGLYYESLREYDKAIADYSQVIGGNTDFSRLVEGKDGGLALAYHYRGRAYQWYKHDNAKAVADFSEALRLKPDIDEMVYYRRGDAYHALKDYANAEKDYATALGKLPHYPNLLSHWAWQMATCPEAKLRDGKRAIELATKATGGLKSNNPEHIDALAAAYAEDGQFAEAAKWEQRALELQGERGPEQLKAMRERLELYQASRPFRESASR